MGVKDAGDTIMYSKEDKMKHYMDYCSICLCRFIKGAILMLYRTVGEDHSLQTLFS